MGHLEEGHANAVWFCSDDKPNIFLIGDSIRLGYEPALREAFGDEVNIFSPTNENCRTSQHIATSLGLWSNKFDFPKKVDIVQFNCGHWDAAHWFFYPESVTSLAEYEKNIRMIIYIIKKVYPGAKIVFATTTPMNPEDPVGVSMNPRSTEEISRYNAAAVKVATEEGVYVNDLNSFCKDWGAEYYSDYCHYTKDSYKLIAEEVKRYVKTIL